MGVKTLAVAVGAAAVLGGAGMGVAQASSPAPVTGSSTSVGPEADHAAGHRTGHENEARGRVAEGETHARHTGTDDPATPDDNGRTRTPGAGPGSSTDDHGSGGHD